MKKFGIWAGSFRLPDAGLVGAAVAELDELGYGVLWYPGGTARTFEVADSLLRGTRRSLVATGIASIWVNQPGDAAEQTTRLNSRYGNRFLLGLGVSHQPMVERLRPGAWRPPLEQMTRYLDELDGIQPTVPRQARLLAALGPRMLALAGSRTAGTHPYLVTPDQTAAIRASIGPDALVAVEQGVVLDADRTRGRSTAREALAMYLGLPNYVNNWKRAGFTADDVAGGGSDRLVDALVARGPAEHVVSRLREHLDAGADHVCLQVLGSPAMDMPLRAWRELAAALDLNG